MCLVWTAAALSTSVPAVCGQERSAEPPAAERPILAVDAGGHTGRIDKLLLSAYGDQLISVSHDKTIRFWDIQTGEPLRVLRPAIGDGLEGQLFAAALAPDGSRLAVGGFRALTPINDHRVLVISLPGGELEHCLKGHLGPIHGLAFSPDGGRLASASHDETVRVWNLADGREVWTLRGHTNNVMSVAWSPDGKRLVSGSWDRTARIWSAQSGAAEATLAGHAQDVLGVAWSRDGRTIATGSADRSVRLWEPAGTVRYAWHNLANDVQTVAFSEDSTQLLYTWGSRDNNIHGAAVLDLRNGCERSRFTGHSNTPMTGIFVSRGTLAATAGAPGDVCLWKTADGCLVRRMSSKGQPVASAGWSPDGQAIAWGHSYTGSLIQGTNPLERTFCLSTLSFGPPPEASFYRCRPALEDLSLERMRERQVNVRSHGIHRSMLEIPDFGDKVRCMSLISGRRALLGTNLRIYLFDVDAARQLRWFVGHTDTVHALAPSPDFRYLLSGSIDETLRIWHIERGELLLSLFVAGDEWIAWTPQAYYAASLGGEGLMGWHLNHGVGSMASFYPAARFHKSLYRPDAIRRLLEFGDLQRALDAADQERARESEPITLSAALPPEISITAPADKKVTVTETAVVIRATARPSGQDPVTSLRLLVDGRPRAVRNDRPGDPAGKSGEVQGEWTLSLTPGSHQVAVKAETKSSFTVSEPVEITCQPANGATPIHALYVLAIGISEYSQPGLRLPFAARDAQALVASLEARGQRSFRKVELRVLTDAQATRQAMLEGLAWLRQHATPDDTALVFYAGRSSTDQRGQFHLLPVDGDTSRGESGGVSEQTLRQSAQSTAGRLMLWLDARNTDTNRGGPGFCSVVAPEKETGRAEGEDLLRDLATEDYGLAVMGSGSGRATPRDFEGWTHSVFAQALLDGLSGMADSNRDSTVSLDELEHFVKDRVKDLSGSRQRAVTGRSPLVRPFPLMKSLK